MTDKRSYAEALRSVMAEALPTEMAEQRHADSQLGQTQVWIVGLSSTLLALTLVTPERLSTALGDGYSWWPILLLVAITSGVCSRLMTLNASQLYLSNLRYAWGFVVGGGAGERVTTPPALSLTWSEEQIAERLQAEFSWDLSSIVGKGLPLANWQALYRDRCDFWWKHQTEALESYKAALASRMGQSTDEVWGADDEKTKKRIQQRSTWIRWLGFGGQWFFRVSAVSFVGAVTIATIGVVSQATDAERDDAGVSITDAAPLATSGQGDDR